MSEPWFSTGLRFECGRCGHCCAAPGHVWLGKAEIVELALHLEMEWDAFGERYLRRIGQRLALVDGPDGACVFLGPEGCRVYEARPRQCRSFPFWEENLADKEHWVLTGTYCPGVGRGEVYGRERIEAIRDGAEDTAAGTQHGCGCEESV